MARLNKSVKAFKGAAPTAITLILAIGAVFVLHRLATSAGAASASEAGYSTSQGGGGGDSAVPAPSTNTGILDSISSGIDRVLNRRPASQQPSQPPPQQFRFSPAPAYGGPTAQYNDNAQAQNPSPQRHVRSHLSPRARQALERNTVRSGTAGIPITQTAARVQQLESRGHSGFRDATIISRQRSAAAQQRQAAQQPAVPSRARSNQFQQDLLSRVRQARR